MTKQDFELIASTLADIRHHSPEVIDELAEVFAAKLANRNEHFNYSRFIAACKGE